MNERKRYLTIIMSSLVIFGFFLLGMGLFAGGDAEESAAPTTQYVLKDEGGFLNLISEVSNSVMPAVVHIDVTGTVVQQAPDIPFFREFFGPPGKREMPIQALGSGVLIDEEGHIITNNHVVQHAEEISVEFSDGTIREAELIGTDQGTDLAVLKIEPSADMRYAPLGDSDQVQVGEWVIAIGSPRGLSWTVTAGIISAKHRTNIGALGPSGYEDFIQTDAAINPGNSGGPLINLEGEIVGINSLIISASRGSEGLGFAVPSNMAKSISRSLIEEGTVVRGYLGVQIQDLTADIRRSLGLDTSVDGVIVADVTADSPADDAGIRQGDIITSCDGEDIETAAQLRNLVAATEPGSEKPVGVLRDGESKEYPVKVGKLGEFRQARLDRESELMGLTVSGISAETAGRLGLRQDIGVQIVDVEAGSPGANAGLSPGDVILRVGNSVVRSPDQFNRLVKAASEDGVVLLLVVNGRTGVTSYITVQVAG